MHYVYFIICEGPRIAYVGTSCARDPLAILRKHLRGEVAETKRCFSAAEGQCVPFMHICALRYEDRACAQVDARYWRRYLRDCQACTVLGDDFAADFLMKSMRARTALGHIDGMSLSEVLRVEGTRNLWSTSRTDKKTLRQSHTPHAKDSVLAIRTDAKLARAFRDLAAQMGATQSQTLAALLDSYSGSTHEVEDLLERIKKAHEHILSLEGGYVEHTQTLEKKVQQLKRKNEILQSMVDESVRHSRHKLLASGQKVPVFSRRQVKERFPERRSYLPPQCAGTCALQVDCMAYGRSAAGCRQPLFIYGTTLDAGEKIRLRWYPKVDYVGIAPAHELFRDSSLLWQVGYIEATDGAMELAGAIPICPEQTSDRSQLPWELRDPTAVTELPEDKLNLDELVDDAKSRSTTRSTS